MHRSWTGKGVPANEKMIVQVHELDGNDNVKVVVSGMFFNDPAPPSPAGKTIVFIMQHPLESNI